MLLTEEEANKDAICTQKDEVNKSLVSRKRCYLVLIATAKETRQMIEFSVNGNTHERVIKWQKMSKI